MPKLLIVDDEPDNVALLARRLTRRGFEVISATAAEEGLALAAAELPHLILMDIQLKPPPGAEPMDGLEVTRRLKASLATAAIPVITVSAFAMPEDRARALAAGAADHQSKPVDLNDLLAKVAALLSEPAT